MYELEGRGLGVRVVFGFRLGVCNVRLCLGEFVK